MKNERRNSESFTPITDILNLRTVFFSEGGEDEMPIHQDLDVRLVVNDVREKQIYHS